MTNKEFAGTDLIFKEACQLANVLPTMRQASKFRDKRGREYQYKQEAEKKCQWQQSNG